MNDALACPRRRFLEGGGYQTPTQKSSLTATSPKDGLWKLTDLTGLWTVFEAARDSKAHSPLENLRFPTAPWTRFEEARGGHAPTSFHSPFFLEVERRNRSRRYSVANAALGST